MRTYGRRLVDPLQPDGPKEWVVVTTDAQGFNDLVYVTTLAQVLKLNLGESPFWANYGIPARDSVIQQIYPDFFASRTQEQFASYFASLIISRRNIELVGREGPTPVYDVNVITHQGVRLNPLIPIPT